MTKNGLSEFEQFIGGYEVALELKRVEANPVLAGNSRKDGLAHYRCMLLRRGKQLAVYLSVGAEDDPPTLFDVLFMVALDASGCDVMAGFEKYREKWHSIFGESGRKPGDIEFFWEELESRCRQTRKVSDFLGPEAFEEMLRFFGLEENGNLNPEEGGSTVTSVSS